MAKRKRTRKKPYEKDLDKILAKIEKTKPPSKRQERARTATNAVKTYDMTPPKLDPYLEGIMRYHVNAKAPKKGKKAKSLGARVNAAVAARKASQVEYANRVEEARKAIREPRLLPDELPNSLAPKLRKRKPGDKPSIFALVYAFRAFQQFSYAFTRRNVGSSDETYYQGLKARFRSYMRELGLEDQFDWQDF